MSLKYGIFLPQGFGKELAGIKDPQKRMKR